VVAAVAEEEIGVFKGTKTAVAGNLSVRRRRHRVVLYT